MTGGPVAAPAIPSLDPEVASTPGESTNGALTHAETAPGNYVPKLSKSDALPETQGWGGIDGIRLQSRISEVSGRKLMRLQEQHRHMPWEGTKPNSIAGVKVHAYKTSTGYFAAIAANPSRLYDPHGWSLAPAEMLGNLLGPVWAELEAQVGIETPLNKATVTRLDAARDFTDVVAPDRLLDRLSLDQVTPKHLAAHSYRGTNGGKTLALANKSGGRIILYDKSRESPGVAPPGTVRFEVQAHGWLKRFGNNIRDVARGTPTAVERLLTERWETSKMGTAVTTPDRFKSDLKDVIHQRGLGTSVFFSVLGYATALADGWDASEVEPSPNTRKRWGEIIDEVGTLPTTSCGDRRAMVSRLDLPLGREVIFPAFDEAGEVPKGS